MNQFPRESQRSLRLALGALLLIWATQIVASRAFGGDTVSAPGEPVISEKFVPGNTAAAGGTLELRSEATVAGGDVKLRQICRWSDADKAIFAPIADLVVFRVGEKSPFRAISLEELKSTMHDAGVNLAVIRFAGATACTVGRSDVRFDEREALNQWVEARQTALGVATQPATGPANASVAIDPPAAPAPPATVPTAAVPAAPKRVYRTLREILVEDIILKTKLAPELLQIDFAPKDQNLLTLMEPIFSFKITPNRRGLGNISWEVAIATEKDSQRATISASVRAWQHQLIVTKPLAYKQIIREEDLLDRRTLVDQLEDVVLLTRPQAVGQMAAQELKPGTLMTARMVDAVPLVRPGQLVTVTVQNGKIQVTTVGRALGQGTFGQTIQVRNDATKTVFDVQVTGPQQGRMSTAVAGMDTN